VRGGAGAHAALAPERHHARSKRLALTEGTDALSPFAARQDWAPKRVRLCHDNGGRAWWLWTWRRGETTGPMMRAPYRCRSWRCPHCQGHEAHVLWSRVAEALRPAQRRDLVALTLTIDRNGYYQSQKYRSPDAAYRALSRNWRMLLKRLSRLAIREGFEPIGSRWVATVEAHRNGMPHIHAVIWAPGLARLVEREEKERKARGMNGRALQLVPDAWVEHLEACNWGRQSTAEIVRGKDALAGYLVKLARSGEKAAGEVAKLTQLPVNAPLRFRRLRSGRRFLPPRKKSLDYTGALIRRRERNGEPACEPVHLVSPEHRARAVEACAWEDALYLAELGVLPSPELDGHVYMLERRNQNVTPHNHATGKGEVSEHHGASAGSSSSGQEARASEGAREAQGVETQGAEAEGACQQGAEAQGAGPQGACQQGAGPQGAGPQGAEAEGACPEKAGIAVIVAEPCNDGRI